MGQMKKLTKIKLTSTLGAFQSGKNVHTMGGLQWSEWMLIGCFKKVKSTQIGWFISSVWCDRNADWMFPIYLLERHWLGDVSLCIKCAENTKTYTGSLTSGDSGGALFDTQSMHTLIIIWPSSTTIKLIDMFPFQAK